MYWKVAKRVDFKCSHHTQKYIMLCDVREVLANDIVGIILQHVSISNQLIIHLKLTHCYVSYYSLKGSGRGEYRDERAAVDICSVVGRC